MCKIRFINSRYSYIVEALTGYFQSFFPPFALIWGVMLSKRLSVSTHPFKTIAISSFCYYFVNLYWISFALTVEIEKFWWAIPIPLLFFASCCTFFSTLTAFWARSPLLFALSWAVLEWIRSWIFTGFPWGFVGHGFLDSGLSPLFAIAGVYPLTFLSKYFDRFTKSFIVFWLLIVSVGFFNFQENTLSEKKIRMVQPCISQETKWLIGRGEENFQNILSLLQTNDPLVKAIILPECVFTFYFEDFPERLELLKNSLKNDQLLITGAPRRNWDFTHTDYNSKTSLFIINNQGIVLDFYDKAHLIPFGEYVPFRSYLPNLAKITFGEKDYHPGIGPRIMTIPGLGNFHPIICYESAFTHEIRPKDKRGDFIILITNDAWFGKSIGPWQHLNLARIRAIEHGLPIIRVSNTGISAIINAYGKLISQIPLGVSDAIDVYLPTSKSETLYGQYMGLEKWVMIILLIGLMIDLILRKFKHARRK